MYEWEVFQTNKGFKTAISKVTWRPFLGNLQDNNAAKFYFVLLKKHICFSAFLSTVLMAFSEMQNFINVYKWDYF